MKGDKQKKNWLIDAALFVGFLIATLLDLTGLAVHQWLGIAVVALAGYHLLAHQQWVISVTQRFFGRTSGKARRFYLVDAGLLIGFTAIGITGLIISSWLDLTLATYEVWRVVHVVVSVITLGLVVLKIGIHWRWIMTVAARHIFPAPQPAGVSLAAQPVISQARIGRREFVRLMGFVGATALFAGVNALKDDEAGQATTSVALAQTSGAADERPAAQAATPITPTVVPGPTLVPTATAAAQASGAAAKTNAANAATKSATTSCVVRCSKRCSYPGRCRRYVDTNGNRRCDLGECRV
ncbi:MAG: hypothetical protein NT169_14230 [Chloroflexi bacterium]|nr:hypothetical protein [Chloroflexota bacterium]